MEEKIGNYSKSHFKTPKDFLKYYRAWTIYDEKADVLNEWEASFIDDMVRKAPKSFSPKQAACIDRIFERVELL